MNPPAHPADPALTDAEIIRASLDDPSVFGGIFHRHYDAISRYLRRRMPSDAADDLASEVFVIAYERRDSFDSAHASAAPWLYGIVANLMRHRVRQERREWKAYARAYEAPVVEADVEAAVSRADAKAAVETVVEALRALKPDERECLLLTAWASLTNAEIASALDMSIGTVKTNIYRARQRLAFAPDELVSVGGETDA